MVTMASTQMILECVILKEGTLFPWAVGLLSGGRSQVLTEPPQQGFAPSEVSGKELLVGLVPPTG